MSIVRHLIQNSSSSMTLKKFSTKTLENSEKLSKFEIRKYANLKTNRILKLFLKSPFWYLFLWTMQFKIKHEFLGFISVTDKYHINQYNNIAVNWNVALSKT